LPYQPNALIGDFENLLDAVVRRAIIDHHHFHVVQILRKNGVDRAAYRGLFVVERNDCTDALTRRLLDSIRCHEEFGRGPAPARDPATIS
jgi:hypothetical protein